MQKPRNTELNFLYVNEEDIKKEPTAKKRTKKSNKNKTRAGNSKSAQKKIENKNSKQKIVKQNGNKKTQVKKVQAKKNKKKSVLKSFIKWFILISALIAAIIFFLMSPLFNVSEIEVLNNKKISKDTIISLSKIEMGQNIYKTTLNQITKNIKSNPYVEDVKIKRKLPNKIEISIKERKTTYMLEYANSYAYMNNQGYILEISEEKKEVPIIVGYKTAQEDIQAGKRLCQEDLEKMQTVLQITEAMNSNGMENYITRINIENKQNYTLTMEEKKKIIYLGDASNLSNKMLYLKAILKDEEGVEGEIFLNMDLNKENAFFRKKE